MSDHRPVWPRESSPDPIRPREFDGNCPESTSSRQLFEHAETRRALERPRSPEGPRAAPQGMDGGPEGVNGGEHAEERRVNVYDTILAKLVDTFDSMCMNMNQRPMTQEQVDQCHHSLQGLRRAKDICLHSNGSPLSDNLNASSVRKAAVKLILGQLTMLAGDKEDPSKYHNYSPSLKEAMRCDERHLFRGSWVMALVHYGEFWTREVDQKIGMALAGSYGISNAQVPCLALFERLIWGEQGLVQEITDAAAEFRRMREH